MADYAIQWDDDGKTVTLPPAGPVNPDGVPWAWIRDDDGNGFAGMRLGEAAALRVGDIKFLAKEIRIERQVQRANGGAVEIRPPKYESVRTVYAPDELLHILSEHIRLHLPDNSPDQWMFPGEGDHPLHQNSVGYLWRKARNAVASITCFTSCGTSTPPG
jgi:integrase